MAEQSKSSFSQTIVIILLIGLSLYFVISIKNGNYSHKEEIKLLEQEKTALQKELENRVDKDSILYYLTEQKKLEEIINGLQVDIDFLEKIKYEDIDFTKLSIDSNLVLFTKYISE